MAPVVIPEMTRKLRHQQNKSPDAKTIILTAVYVWETILDDCILLLMEKIIDWPW